MWLFQAETGVEYGGWAAEADSRELCSQSLEVFGSWGGRLAGHHSCATLSVMRLLQRKGVYLT